MVDFVWANHESDLIHGLELTFGSNLIDPIGLVHTSGEGYRSYFLSGDVYIGYTVPLEKFKWTPAIRLSVLFPEVTVLEARQMEVRLARDPFRPRHKTRLGFGFARRVLFLEIGIHIVHGRVLITTAKSDLET